MITEEEIARFRHNIPCPLPRSSCKWFETVLGDAWCNCCNSGFRKDAREALWQQYKTDIINNEKS